MVWPPPLDVHAHPLHLIIIIMLCARVRCEHVTRDPNPSPLTQVALRSTSAASSTGQAAPLDLPPAPPVSTPAAGSPLHYLRPHSWGFRVSHGSGITK